MGENQGLPPPGFDIGNSPTDVMRLHLSGRTLVQRTGAGTPGLTRSTNARIRLAASFVVAGATVRFIRSMKPERVAFVVTGQTFHGGDEDLACAQYLEACLCGHTPDPSPYLERVRKSHDAQVFYDPARPEFQESDIMYCTDIDRFSFAMLARQENGKLIMRPLQV
jgi:2-phosphosulfolactate phosphatase